MTGPAHRKAPHPDAPGTRRSRIIHVANHSHRFNGNVHAAIDLACTQAELGHDVMLCSAGGSFDALLEAHKVRVVHLPELAGRAGLPLAVQRLRRLVHSVDADIVHAHMMKSAAVAWMATRLGRARLVTTVHNAFERSAIIMGLGDQVIAVSSAVGSAMQQRGIPEKRIRVVLNGTIGSARYADGPAPLPESLARPAVLYLGGLHPRKGIADLLEAFALARRSRSDLHLYLVGEGPCEAKYRAMVSDQDREHIHFCGSRPDPRSFMLGADVFVLASHADPAPLVLSEAREAGLAVIATRIDGIPELLEDGAAGVLVPPRDPQRLAAALLSVLESDQSLAHHRARSQFNLDHLALDRVAAETLVVYERAHHRRRQHPHQRGVSINAPASASSVQATHHETW